MIRLESAELAVEVSLTGAEVKSVKENSGKEYMWQGQPGFWQRTSPVLFPIVGRLKQDSYSFKDQPYRMTQHGFARDKVFSLLHNNQEEATFILKSDADSRLSYPFDFSLAIQYRLEGNSLHWVYTIQNTGLGPMPFNIGAHPGFNMPPGARLQFPDDDVLHSQRLVDGARAEWESIPLKDGFLPLDDALFSNDALILTELKSQIVRLWQRDGSILVLQRGSMPFLGVWKQAGADFICLEPWQGLADNANDGGELFSKEHVSILSPGASKKLHFSITFSSL